MRWSANRRDGLEPARRKSPSVIVLDLMLPDYGGTEVLTALKALPETRNVPVIICWAFAGRLDARARR